MKRIATTLISAGVAAGLAIAIPTVGATAASYFSTTKIVTKSIPDRGSTVSVTVKCPIGYRVTGGGFDMRGNDGNVYPVASRPYGTTGWTVAIDSGYYSTGSGTAYAVCIR